MTIDVQAAKKRELEITLLGLFKKFTEETGLQVDSIFVDAVETTSFEEETTGKRSFVYCMPEVTAKL